MGSVVGGDGEPWAGRGRRCAGAGRVATVSDGGRTVGSDVAVAKEWYARHGVRRVVYGISTCAAE
ncbi:hypothetical protein C6361_36560 [Plantactinospora sp. BC1]|nr:hypothetical protein C6361_36560 [Plantactinospora sp. BC1]